MSEALGYAASSAVLATFLMRSMVPLRLVAILSNVLFMGYGYLAHIHPVFVLHAALLPINLARLAAPGSGDVLRRISLFVLGVMTGLLGMRAAIHIVMVLSSNQQEFMHVHLFAPGIFD
jgi:hypothetical protein